MSTIPQARTPRRFALAWHRLNIGIVVFIAFYAAIAFLQPNYLEAGLFMNFLRRAAPLAILAAGQLYVILTGGFDLSVGAIVSLVSVIVGALLAVGLNIWLACAAGLVAGALLGLINGILVNYLRIPSLMATLATMFAYGGLALATTEGRPFSNFPEGFAWLGLGQTFGIPNSFLFVLLPVAVILHVMLTRTVIGRHIIACGNDDRAAHLSGLDVARIRTGLYVLSGVLSAIGAIIAMSWFMAARPDAGKGMELLAVTIAVLGGTHIFGGTGGVPGAIVAILIVTTLQIGLQLANISAAWQLGVIGVLLIGSVSSLGGLKLRWRTGS